MTDADRKIAVVEKEGVCCTIHYYLPTIVIPGDETAEQKVNAEVEKTLNSLLKTLKNNYQNNFEPMMMGALDEYISVSFYQSDNTLSLLFYYTVLAGNGDFVSECKSVNFDRGTAETVTVFDRIKDRTAVINYITANIEAGDEPDLDILHRQPGTGGAALCHAWYIDHNTLTVIYNGETVNTFKVTVTEVHVLDRSLYDV